MFMLTGHLIKSGVSFNKKKKTIVVTEKYQIKRGSII